MKFNLDGAFKECLEQHNTIKPTLPVGGVFIESILIGKVLSFANVLNCVGNEPKYTFCKGEYRSKLIELGSLCLCKIDRPDISLFHLSDVVKDFRKIHNYNSPNGWFLIMCEMVANTIPVGVLGRLDPILLFCACLCALKDYEEGNSL